MKWLIILSCFLQSFHFIVLLCSYVIRSQAFFFCLTCLHTALTLMNSFAKFTISGCYLHIKMLRFNSLFHKSYAAFIRKAITSGNLQDVIVQEGKTVANDNVGSVVTELSTRCWAAKWWWQCHRRVSTGWRILSSGSRISSGHAHSFSSFTRGEQQSPSCVTLSLQKLPSSLPRSNRLSWWNDLTGQQWGLSSSLRTCKTLIFYEMIFHGSKLQFHFKHLI